MSATRAPGARTPNQASRLPVQPLIASAALSTLRTGERAQSQLSRLVTVDPALTVAVMRLANAPHLGLSRRVASARQSMVMLGTKAVNALTTSGTAALVLSDDDLSTPEGFWTRSLTTAVASANIARRVGSSPEEAFSAGILTEIGDLLLQRMNPLVHAELRAEMGPAYDLRALQIEKVEFGVTHAEAAGDQLERWWFPDRVVRAVRLHHERPEIIADTLPRVVRCGAALMNLIHRQGPSDTAAVNESFAVFGTGNFRIEGVVSEVVAEVQSIADDVAGLR